MKFTAHPYQTKAIKWVKTHPRCGLFLDMGLGKTVATLTAIRDLLDEAEIRKVLVVAPKKVAEATWSTEAQKWDHLQGLRVVKVMGTASQRTKALSEDADIYVMGRDSVAWLLDVLQNDFPFDCIVIDELTSFKSTTAKRFKVMKRWTAKAQRVIGLTGTPVPNGFIDLWAQIYCLDGGQRLGKFVGRFRDTYLNAFQYGNFVTKYTLKANADKAILDKLGDICLTMQAKDYLTLPDMVEITERIELPKTLMEQYHIFERDQISQFKQSNGNLETIVGNSAAAMMNKLAQYANGAIYTDEHEVIKIHGEKVERLAEIVEEAQSPVLVFYQFKHDIKAIQAGLAGKKVTVYEGEDDLKAWNDGKIDVLLAHPASTSYGLNMQQGGHYIVWFGTGWNLEYYQQANARLHRQGQKHPVMVYRLICKGTVDEMASAAIDRKSGVQDAVIGALKTLIKKYDK